MTRIRYTEINEGTELLSKLNTTTFGVVVIRINLTKSAFSIATEVGQELAKGEGTTRQNIMKKVKEALKQLGITFYDEVRLSKTRKK